MKSNRGIIFQKVIAYFNINYFLVAAKMFKVYANSLAKSFYR